MLKNDLKVKDKLCVNINRNEAYNGHLLNSSEPKTIAQDSYSRMD